MLQQKNQGSQESFLPASMAFWQHKSAQAWNTSSKCTQILVCKLRVPLNVSLLFTSLRQIGVFLATSMFSCPGLAYYKYDFGYRMGYFVTKGMDSNHLCCFV